jgi:BON domain
VKVRIVRLMAAAVGVAIGASAMGAEPAKLSLPKPEVKLPEIKAPSQLSDTKSGVQLVANQKLADKVADKLATVSAMQHADVSLFTAEGCVTVTGTCKTAADKKSILECVSMVDGVKLVKDGVKVSAPVAAPTSPVRQTQAIGGPLAMAAPAPMAGGNPDIEPLPLGPAGGGMNMGAPPLPNHAWPTYAPYPNMSRVGYPTAYPTNAFPFIGPFYPFPKVPLGWRSVTMSYEDGHWWLGRKQTPQDYWRVKFGY